MCFEVNLNLSLINVSMKHFFHPFRKLILWWKAMYSSVHPRKGETLRDILILAHAKCLQALSNLIPRKTRKCPRFTKEGKVSERR